jgi:hypothetical protein
MILKYNGSRKLFVYQNVDFSTGKAEVDNVLGEKWIADSNGTFTLWEPPTPAPVIKASPASKPKPKIVVKPKVVAKSKSKK